jgi:ATP-binding cassette, subfamily B, bacterial CvaB/MchF/RaxB
MNFSFRHKALPLQESQADCGYVCASVAFDFFGQKIPPHRIRANLSSTSRGLSIQQLAEIMRALGANVVAVAFNCKEIQKIPVPTILLLKRAHYVVFMGFNGKTLSVYDPAVGWQEWSQSRMVEEVVGIGLGIKSVKKSTLALKEKSKWHISASAFRSSLKSDGLKVLFLTFLAQGLALLLPLATQHAVDQIGIGKEVGIIALFAVAYLLLSIVGNISMVLMSISTKKLARYVALIASGALFDRLASKDMLWFERRPQAFAFNQFNAVMTIYGYYGELASHLFIILMTGAVGLIAMFFVSPWLVLPGFVTLILSTLIAQAFQRPRQTQASRQIQTQQRVRSFFFDVVAQMPALKRYGVTRRAKATMRVEMRMLANLHVANAALSSTQTALTGFVSSVERLVFICLAGYFMLSDKLTLGAFVAIGLYKDLFVNSLAGLLQLWRAQANLLPQRFQLAELLDSEAAPLRHFIKPVSTSIDISNLSFRYDGLDPWVLKDITFKIEAGECIALQGPSGAGKTTLIKLLCGLLQPTSGNVTVDGHAMTTLINCCGIVLQTDRLITGSIADNITFFRGGKTREQVLEILKIVELDSFIESLPMGLDTGIGEDVAGLSGGQRQRILLARALVSRPPFIMLDEATSALDAETENRVLSNIHNIGVTTILCSHRNAVLKYANRVFEVSSCKLIQREIYEMN